MEDNYIRLYFSNGWVYTYDNDACVMSSIFKYRIFRDINTGLLAVSFPSYVLSRVISKLQYLKVSYMCIGSKDKSRDFKNENTYKDYLDLYIPRNNRVEVGDTVILESQNTKEKEEYTIVPSYIEVESTGKWGEIVLEKVPRPLDYSNQEILSESEFGKTLLSSSRNKYVTLKDENLVQSEYLVKDIIKRDYYARYE